MVFMDVLLGLNSCLLLLIIWAGREYWRAHREQHTQILDRLNALGDVYATKSSLERVHKRLDGLERSRMNHDSRLVQLETRLGCAAQHHGPHLPGCGLEMENLE